MAPGTTGPFEEMEDAFNSGWIAFDVPGTEPVAGKVTPAQVFVGAKSTRGYLITGADRARTADDPGRWR
jgi:hypothetical protein